MRRFCRTAFFGFFWGFSSFLFLSRASLKKPDLSVW